MTKFNRITLRFENPETEKKFQEEKYFKMLGSLRLSLIFGIFIYGVFFIFDYFILPDDLVRLLINRVFVSLIAFIVLLISYHKNFKKNFFHAIVLLYIVVGIGTIDATTIDEHYLTSLHSIIVFFTLIPQLRLLVTSIINILLMFIMALALIFFSKMEMTYILLQMMLLVATIVVCGIILYIKESLERNSFIQTQELISQKKEISQKNTEVVIQKEELEAMNEEFETINEELTVTNEDLYNQREELQIANATKDKFFNIIAHDLKSPFNTLLGLSELLAENIQTYDIQTTQKIAENLHYTTAQIHNLLENLLDWARTQQNRIDFNPEKNDIEIKTRESINLLKPTAENKRISLIQEIKPGSFAQADTYMLNVILRNLVSNAIKFTQEGGSVIVKAMEQGSMIQISVTDNGVGIKLEVADNLFRIDTNVSQPGTAGEKGTGLGLLLCKEFVEKHGGKIWVESEVGKGSTFYFTLRKFDDTVS